MTRCPSFPSPNPGKKRAINCHKLTWREGGSYFSLKDGTNVPLNGDTEDRGKIIHDGSAIGANRFPVPWNESIVRRARRKGEKGVERGDVSAELSIVNCTAREEERERGAEKRKKKKKEKKQCTPLVCSDETKLAKNEVSFLFRINRSASFFGAPISRNRCARKERNRIFILKNIYNRKSI